MGYNTDSHIGDKGKSMKGYITDSHSGDIGYK